MSTLYPLIMGREAMVSTEHYLSAAAGARIFDRGGNAIDAAVAAALVEGVVNPHMHTIGGEAPMLIFGWGRTSAVVSINGNTMAPARATIAHYRALGLDLVPGEGLLAAGVPAAFGAFACALENFGTKSLAEVAGPRWRYAKTVSRCIRACAATTSRLTFRASAWDRSAPTPSYFATRWPSTARIYMPGGELPRSGDHHQESSTGEFLPPPARRRSRRTQWRPRGRIAAAVERFYRGDIAREIVAHSDANGGLLALEDLAALHHPDRRAGEPHLPRRNRLQMRTVVAGPGLPATARAAGGLRSRRDGP